MYKLGVQKECTSAKQTIDSLDSNCKHSYLDMSSRSEGLIKLQCSESYTYVGIVLHVKDEAVFFMLMCGILYGILVECRTLEGEPERSGICMCVQDMQGAVAFT